MQDLLSGLMRESSARTTAGATAYNKKIQKISALFIFRIYNKEQGFERDKNQREIRKL